MKSRQVSRSVLIRCLFSILCLAFAALLLSPHAAAVSLELEATEYINGLVFYPDGTYDSGNVTGSLSVTNPSLNHTVSDINISFGDGITPSDVHINELGPESTTTVSYESPGPVKIPLPSVKETVEPSALYRGTEQEVVFRVEISNPGSENISVLSFDREFPEELEFASFTFSAGSLNRTGNSFHWENFSVSPGSAECLLVVFNTTPASDIVLKPSSLSFTTPSLAVSGDLSLSAVTSTRFAVEKQKIGKDQWNVGVVVEDASDFDCLLGGVEVYVSDLMLTEPKLIREYAPDLRLEPGESWRDSFTYEYEGTPVFFAKVFYTIPCTISGSSMPLSASESGGFVISSIVSGTSDTPAGIFEPEDGGNFVVDPVVSDDGGHRHHSDDGERLRIIRPIYPVLENELEPDSAPRKNADDTPERVETEKSRFSLLLLLLLLPLIIIPFFARKRLVVGSSSLKEIYDANGLDLLFSGRRKILISRNEFGKITGMEDSEMLEALKEPLEKGQIKVVDTDAGSVNEIMERYGISAEDADILATAVSGGVKDVLLKAPESEKAAREMGLKPVGLSEILNLGMAKSS